LSTKNKGQVFVVGGWLTNNEQLTSNNGLDSYLRRKKAYKHQKSADDYMKDVVSAFPLKLLFGKDMREAGHRLVEVDQAEPDVEIFYRRPLDVKNQDTPEHTEDDMKNIVGRGAACQAFVGRDKKA
jgi:hypothetical protein